LFIRTIYANAAKASCLRDLRPFDAGEILDRAITLLIRYFWKLTLVSVAAVLPIAILTYAANPNSMSRGVNAWLGYAVIPARESAPRAPIICVEPEHWYALLTAIVLILSALIALLGFTACAIAVSHWHAGTPISFGRAYSRAAGRWLSQIALTGIFVAMVSVGLFLFLIVVGTVALALHARGASPSVSLAIGIGVLGAIAVMSVPVFFLWQVASTAVAVEDAGPWRACVRACKRTFARRVIWRSALVAGVLAAFESVGFLIVETLALIANRLSHHDALASVVEWLGLFALGLIVLCYLVVYVSDLRIRTEGYDLSHALQDLPDYG
jgi:hypothetical protein